MPCSTTRVDSRTCRNGWYSYDEFGRLTFSAQHLKALDKYVYLDYQYNYLGQITRVAYQKDIAGEAFFHHYTYDGRGADTRSESRDSASLRGVRRCF